MEKYLVTIEFRYLDAPKGEYDSSHKSKTITIGVFDSIDEAHNEGNKSLEVLESKFKMHTFPQGYEAAKERFSKKGGCFGSAKNLITNLAYLKTPFEFYAKVTTLKYLDINETISNIAEARNRYKDYKALQDD